ncbi:MAG TPA: DUF192 domain-containing protein [Spirochaetia bacterium]|nr:DUF192 domain-containing protein [Spirochaetia bacterium]
MRNSRVRTVLIGLAAALAASLAGCSQSLEKVQLRVGGHLITAEVARTESQREQGLMGRTRLGPSEGMIFLFDRDEHLEFWMKNTPLPLSIAFLSAEGKILEIRDMQPFDLRTVRSRLSARYALEMNQGAFQKLGIADGDLVIFPDGFTR